ncbi:hypothetical protein K2V69_09505 [Staphylococcus gallinarum]|nr:hypothetical protein [Staphylococcus gallinarum]MCD8920935.1 hypothetical protein [Staphylococcus gallinarum]
MSGLYKITLLITMAVVTWKVWKIEKLSITKNQESLDSISSLDFEKLLANSIDSRYW